jgi:hypothetical protein
LALIFLSSLLLGQVAFVEGAGECPSAVIVEQRVRGILGLKPEAVLDERALLIREAQALRVVVRNKDGSVLGERVLETEGTCEEVEQIVAVVVATWISDVHPEFLAALPAAETEAATAEPEPEPPAAAPVIAPAPSPPRAPVVAVPAPAPARAPAERARRWELAAAGGAGFSGAPVSALGSLGVRWMPERSGLGAALAATAMTPRTERLSLGSVRYWRWPLSAGPALRAPLGAGHLDFHLGGALGWVHAVGRNFQQAETRDALRGGGLVSIRGAYASGRLQAFVEVSGLAWGKTEIFVRRGTEEPSMTLPTLEVFAAAGVAFVL